LPPMVPREQVLERQRMEDLRAFRKYLVDTGSVESLVKLYKHIAKNELRMDNPTLLKEFFATYQHAAPEAQEIALLDRENATLREYNQSLEGQISDLTNEIEECRTRNMGRALWRFIVSPEFWEGRPGGGEELGSSGLTLAQIYERFCGSRVDRLTGLTLVDLLLEPIVSQAAASSAVVTKDAFLDWIVRELPEAIRAQLRDELLPQLTSTPVPKEPPFETELILAIKESGMYPDDVKDVSDVVTFDNTFQAFLEAAAEYFAG